MEEKKAYEKQLEEEAKQRLEKLRLKLGVENQTTPTNNNNTSVESKIEQKKATSVEVKSEKIEKTSESRAKWAYKRFVEITK